MRRSRPRWSSRKHPRHRSGPDADPCPLSLVLPHRLAPTFGRDPLPDERKANARGAAGLMEDRSATWAMGAGGIATRGSGVTDEADPSGSYPRCGCGRGLSGRRAWSSPARISITTQPTTDPRT